MLQYFIITAVNRYANWITGTISRYAYQVKVYDTPSESFGICGGRVSKLFVVDNSTAYVILSYDRAWSAVPEFPEDVELLDALLLFCDSLPDYAVWKEILKEPKKYVVFNGNVYEFTRKGGQSHDYDYL